MQYERSNTMRKLQKYEDSEIVLDDAQNEEMCDIVQSIGDDELEKLYIEGEKHGVGTIMKDIWITDVQQRKKQFFNDQDRNSMLILNHCYYFGNHIVLGFGGRGNRWNSITIRMGKLLCNCLFLCLSVII